MNIIVIENGQTYKVVRESINDNFTEIVNQLEEIINQGGNTPVAEASIWLAGDTEPSDDIGKDNDFYLQSNTGTVYNKVNGCWEQNCCLAGPQGECGEPGATGSKGATGATGPQGPVPMIHVNGMGGGEKTMAELGPGEGILAICTQVSGGSFFTSVTDGTVKCNGASFTSSIAAEAGKSYVISNTSSTTTARIYCKNNGGSRWTIVGDVL